MAASFSVRDAGERSHLLAENERLIVALKQANQELEERVEARTRELAVSERRCLSIVEGTRDAVMLLDPSGIIVSVNPAFARVTGYNADECLGTRPGFLSSGRHPSGFFAQILQLTQADAVMYAVKRSRRGRAEGETVPETR